MTHVTFHLVDQLDCIQWIDEGSRKGIIAPASVMLCVITASKPYLLFMVITFLFKYFMLRVPVLSYWRNPQFIMCFSSFLKSYLHVAVSRENEFMLRGRLWDVFHHGVWLEELCNTNLYSHPLVRLNCRLEKKTRFSWEWVASRLPTEHLVRPLHGVVCLSSALMVRSPVALSDWSCSSVIHNLDVWG